MSAETSKPQRGKLPLERACKFKSCRRRHSSSLPNRPELLSVLCRDPNAETDQDHPRDGVQRLPDARKSKKAAAGPDQYREGDQPAESQRREETAQLGQLDPEQGPWGHELHHEAGEYDRGLGIEDVAEESLDERRVHPPPDREAALRDLCFFRDRPIPLSDGKQRSDPQIAKVCRARKLQQQEGRCAGRQKERHSYRRGDSPNEQSADHPQRRQQSRLPASSQAVPDDQGCVGAWRHDEQDRRWQEREYQDQLSDASARLQGDRPSHSAQKASIFIYRFRPEGLSPPGLPLFLAQARCRPRYSFPSSSCPSR